MAKSKVIAIALVYMYIYIYSFSALLKKGFKKTRKRNQTAEDLKSYGGLIASVSALIKHSVTTPRAASKDGRWKPPMDGTRCCMHLGSLQIFGFTSPALQPLVYSVPEAFSTRNGIVLCQVLAPAVTARNLKYDTQVSCDMGIPVLERKTQFLDVILIPISSQGVNFSLSIKKLQLVRPKRKLCSSHVEAVAVHGYLC